MTSVLWAPLAGWAVVALVMLALWIVQRVRKNAGIVDVAWAFGTGLLGVFFAWGAISGDPTRRLVIAGMAALWGCRLGFYLIRRVLAEQEDGRYRQLKAQWGSRAQLYLFLFFQIQAVWAVLFALPMWAAANNPQPAMRWMDWAAVAFWLVSVVGETVADSQLSSFRKNPANRGKVCQEGLWRYSRHPNYFFEWLHWWSYPLLALGTALWWLALAGPLLMLFFLFKVTGIPPTEKRALESRGDAYRRYQETTSVFVPWPPKKEAGR